MKVRGRSHWKGFTVIFYLFSQRYSHFGALPHDETVTPSAATDATISFLVCTFQKVIVPANFDFFFFFPFCSNGRQEAWERSQKYHNTEGDIRGVQRRDGELWRSSLISELPRRDKGPLKSQETEQSKSWRTFQEKQCVQKHNMIQDVALSEHLMKALAEQVWWIISKEWYIGQTK